MNEQKIQLDSLLTNEQVLKTSSLYYVNDRESTLLENSGRITEAVIDAYIESVSPVLRYLDPFLEFDEEEIVSRRLLGKKKRKYSNELRESVFETLLILKNNSKKFTNCEDGFIEKRTKDVIAEMLDDQAEDWRFWCTNDKYLPMMALIAPDAYLKAVNETIKNENELKKIKNVLLRERWIDGDWLNNVRYSLSLLAYYEESFAVCILSLINLAEYDNDSNRHENRCYNTIINIVNPYRPSTLYPSNDIPEVLLGILNRNKKHKNAILRELLPHKRNTFCSFSLPEWMPKRELVNKISKSDKANANYLNSFKKYTIAYIESITNYSGLIELINELPYLLECSMCLDREMISLIKDTLNSNKLTSLSKRERGLVWEGLVKAKLKTSKNLTSIFNEVIEKYEPNDVMAKCLLYFDNDNYELIGRHTEDYSKKEQQLQKEALSAIESVYTKKGVGGIYTMAKEAKYTLKLASFVPQASFVDKVLSDISEMMQTGTVTKDIEEFAKAVIFADSCIEDLKTLLAKLDYSKQKEAAKINILLAIRPGKEVWDTIPDDMKKHYWEKIKLNRYYDWSLEEFEYCINELGSVGRQRDSIEIATTALYKKLNLTNDTLLNLLENLKIESERPLSASESQDIEEIILRLQKSENNTFRLALIELKFIAIFEKWRSDLYPSNLMKIIGTNPRYFCELCDQLFSGNGNYQIYRILHDFHIRPGLNNKGKITKKTLKEWVDYVEDYYSQDEEKLSTVHSMLGQNLSSLKCDVPISDDAILDFLENNKRDDYYNGFLIGVSNTRGVIHVDEKHEEEKRLNKIWLNAAKDVEKRGFVNVASLFRKVSEIFLEDARRIDEENAIRNAGTI